MSLLVLGVNHHTAPVALRERLALTPETHPDVIAEILKIDSISEAVMVSTCNRTEIYCEQQHAVAELRLWLKEQFQLTDKELSESFYVFHEKAAVQHLMRVASGLDSMVIGEQQIFGQIKSAFFEACLVGAVGTILGRLFQQVFKVAKQVRSTSEIGACPVSIASTAVQLSLSQYGNADEVNVLLLGAGDTIDLAAKHFVSRGVKNLTIANRSLPKAKSLAAEYDAEALQLSDIISILPEVDVIVSATASLVPVVRAEVVAKAMTQRPTKPLFIVDVAVPRDIEQDVEQIDNVSLFSVDDLKRQLDRHHDHRKHAAAKAESMVARELESFMKWQKSLDCVPTISRYRERVSAVRDLELEKARRKLALGMDSHQVLEFLANSLCQKLMHNPSKQMRTAGVGGEDDLLSLVHQLLEVSQEQTH